MIRAHRFARIALRIARATKLLSHFWVTSILSFSSVELGARPLLKLRCGQSAPGFALKNKALQLKENNKRETAGLVAACVVTLLAS